MSDTKPKVLIIIGDAAETVDTMYPYFRLIEGDMNLWWLLRKSAPTKW